MRPHEERVLAERNELEGKLTKLRMFLRGGNEAYRQLPLMEKERLRLQEYLMTKYLAVLDDRIAAFEEI